MVCVVTYGEAELDGVHRLVEGPGELMLPQSLHHNVLHVLQLVRLPNGHKCNKHDRTAHRMTSIPADNSVDKMRHAYSVENNSPW